MVLTFPASPANNDPYPYPPVPGLPLWRWNNDRQFWQGGVGGVAGPIINVSDFGAVGDGVTDDYLAIQAALNTAFGDPSLGSPGPNGARSTMPVYFPAGVYSLSLPLQVRSITGARVFGAGKHVSILRYDGPFNLPNLHPVDDTLPVIWFNGATFLEIDNLSFVSRPDLTNGRSCCLWIGPDGNPVTSSHGNVVYHCSFSGGDVGARNWATGGQAVSETLYINCDWSDHARIGFWVQGFNTLNFQVLGGSFTNCGNGTFQVWPSLWGTAILNPSGSIPVIQGVHFEDNWCDYATASADPTVIEGCVSESPNFCMGNTVILGSLQKHGMAQFQGTVSNRLPETTIGSTPGYTGCTLHVTNVAGTLKPGMLVFGGESGNGIRFGRSNPGGMARWGTAIGYQINSTEPGGAMGGAGDYFMIWPPTSGGFGNFVNAGDIVAPQAMYAYAGFCSGGSTVQGSQHDGNSVFSGQGLALRAVEPDFLAANMATRQFSWADGMEISLVDLSFRHIPNRDQLPPPAWMSGARTLVGDAPQVADASTFGQPLNMDGTGTNTIPVYCDQTTWRVG